MITTVIDLSSQAFQQKQLTKVSTQAFPTNIIPQNNLLNSYQQIPPTFTPQNFTNQNQTMNNKQQQLPFGNIQQYQNNQKFDIPIIKQEESSVTCMLPFQNTSNYSENTQLVNIHNNINNNYSNNSTYQYSIQNLQQDLQQIQQQNNSVLQQNTVQNQIDNLKRKPLFDSLEFPPLNKKICLAQQDESDSETKQQYQLIDQQKAKQNPILWINEYMKNPKIMMLLMNEQQMNECAKQLKQHNITLEQQIQKNQICIDTQNMFSTINQNIYPKKVNMPNQNKNQYQTQKQQQDQQIKYNSDGKPLQKKSKFHNKNKLFINRIIRFFHLETLENISMPNKLKQVIFTFIDEARKTAREIVDGKVIKTDLFSHSHYKLLFLTLNQHTISMMAKNDKDHKLHLEILDVDLRKDIDQDKIQFINFLKNCVHEICVRNLKNKIVDFQQESNDQEYERRAFFGIQQMINGNHVSRF